MKNIQVTFCFLLVSLFSIASVHAHDPSEHTAKMEKPKCEAMKNMDHSKLDTKDPIMMAMMKKCMSEESAENHHDGDTEKNTTDDSDANKVVSEVGCYPWSRVRDTVRGVSVVTRLP